MAVTKPAFIINLSCRNPKSFCTNVSILKNSYFNLSGFILYAFGEKIKEMVFIRWKQIKFNELYSKNAGHMKKGEVKGKTEESNEPEHKESNMDERR